MVVCTASTPTAARSVLSWQVSFDLLFPSRSISCWGVGSRELLLLSAGLLRRLALSPADGGTFVTEYYRCRERILEFEEERRRYFSVSTFSSYIHERRQLEDRRRELLAQLTSPSTSFRSEVGGGPSFLRFSVHTGREGEWHPEVLV